MEGTYLAWLDCRQAGIPAESPGKFFLEEAKVALNEGTTFGKAAKALSGSTSAAHERLWKRPSDG